MDKDFVLEMANTIKDQLVGMTPVECHSFMGHREFCGNGVQGHGCPQISCERTAVPWQCHHRVQRHGLLRSVLAKLCRYRVHRRCSVFLRAWPCH